MRCSKYKPHLLVLPEDDANRQIANGFLLHLELDSTAIQVLTVAGGWGKVVDAFTNVHLHEMKKYPFRNLLLIIDFDKHVEDRLVQVKREIPSSLIDRVFVLGTLSEPEKLRSSLHATWEGIGKRLSQDCADGTREIWGHELLKHNERELDRIIKRVKPFLFPQSSNSMLGADPVA